MTDKAAPVNPTPKKLWLWKNFVNGRPEYWAFDNAYPTYGGGDPITLGEPCGYAIFKESTVAPERQDVPEAEVIDAIKRARRLCDLALAQGWKEDAERAAWPSVGARELRAATRGAGDAEAGSRDDDTLEPATSVQAPISSPAGGGTRRRWPRTGKRSACTPTTSRSCAVNSPETHLEPPSASGQSGRVCDTCGREVVSKRKWARFCSTKCRNAFHDTERRLKAQRAAAPELYEALLAARQVIRGKDAEHVWINYPTVPEISLGVKMDQALAKAGYKEPKPEPVPEVASA